MEHFHKIDYGNIGLRKVGIGMLGYGFMGKVHSNACLILPRGHNAGWEYGHVHAISHFVNCVVNDLPVAPYGATFEDGYRVQVIMEKLKESSKTGKRIDLKF